MNAYIVTIRLFERQYEDDPWTSSGDERRIVTIAKSIADACLSVPEAYKLADDTDTKEFDWQVVSAEEISCHGIALPKLPKGLAPKT